MGIRRQTAGRKSTRFATSMKDETTKPKGMIEKKSETVIKMDFSRFSYSQGDSVRRDCLETIDNNRFVTAYAPSEEEGLVGLQFLASWDSNSSQQTSEDWDALSADDEESHLESSDKRDGIDMTSVSEVEQSPSSANVSNVVPTVPRYRVMRKPI